MRNHAIFVMFATISGPALASGFPLIDKTQSEVARVLSVVRQVPHVDCSTDATELDFSMNSLLKTQETYSSNYYLMRNPQGSAAVRLLGQGWALARVESADKLLERGCNAEANRFYRDVIKTSSDVSLQNRAMLGIEDTRAKGP